MDGSARYGGGSETWDSRVEEVDNVEGFGRVEADCRKWERGR